jgi:type I restriction enzyme S subunit
MKHNVAGIIDGLPANWSAAPLGEIVILRSERAHPATAEHLPYIGMENVEANTNRILSTAPASSVSSWCAHFWPGDVLYGKMRPYLNKVASPTFEGLASAEFLVFAHSAELNSSYLKLRLSSPDFVDYSCGQIAGDRPRVKFEQLSKFIFWLPPRKEQDRIVEKVEELLSDLEAGVAEMLDARTKLQYYRRSLIRSAVTGELSANWRETRLLSDGTYKSGTSLLDQIKRDRINRGRTKFVAQANQTNFVSAENGAAKHLPESWISTISAAVGIVQLGRQRTPKYHFGENMVPYLRVANVFENRIDVQDVMKMHFSSEDEELYRLMDGDILLNEGQSAELVGRSAIYRGELPRACFTNTLIRFRAEKGVLPEYAQVVFLDHFYSGRFREVSKTTTNIAHLGATRFATTAFPLPPTEEQVEIIRKLYDAFERISEQESQIERSLEQAKAQRQNILKTAFQGSLVPQNAEDEPASILLETIVERRNSSSKKPKPRNIRVKNESAMMTSKVSVDHIREAILAVPNEKFTFEELRQLVPSDYEVIKEAIFSLISSQRPKIKQVFDVEKRAMIFVRVEQ